MVFILFNFYTIFHCDQHLYIIQHLRLGAPLLSRMRRFTKYGCPFPYLVLFTSLEQCNLSATHISGEISLKQFEHGTLQFNKFFTHSALAIYPTDVGYCIKNKKQNQTKTLMRSSYTLAMSSSVRSILVEHGKNAWRAAPRPRGIRNKWGLQIIYFS